MVRDVPDPSSEPNGSHGRFDFDAELAHLDAQLARLDGVSRFDGFDDGDEADEFDQFDQFDELDDRDLVDPDARPEHGEAVDFASKVASWSRSSMLGLVMTGWSLGIQEVLEPKAEHQIVIEVDDSGLPHSVPIELFLDPDDPSGSLCIVHRTPRPPVV
ncbi:MAG TPA: hypothetical protein VGM93_15975 [Acidimicrobiales bacterium]|jgi:hypothetical protein